MIKGAGASYTSGGGYQAYYCWFEEQEEESTSTQPDDVTIAVDDIYVGLIDRAIRIFSPSRRPLRWTSDTLNSITRSLVTSFISTVNPFTGLTVSTVFARS